MKKARAAQIWAGLEKRLIERCGLPDGHMLDRERPNLIRRIGAVLTGKAAAGDTVSPPLRLDDSAPTVTMKLREKWVDDRHIEPPPPDFKIDRTRKEWWNPVHDPKLAAYLDRACSLRGYDDDDSVGYS